MSLERSGQSEPGERALPEQEYNGQVVDRGGQHDRDVPDLVLDVPTLKVDELELEVGELKVHVSMRAELADLVKINAGVDIYLSDVKLGIKGVEAKALLTVKLRRVLDTLDQALEAINRNPQILDETIRSENKEAEQETDSQTNDEVNATSAARKKAWELGVRLSGVEGTGSGGRVLVRDVQKAAR